MSRLIVDFIIIASLTIMLVIWYCLLAMASKWDDISEEEWKEYNGEKSDGKE